MAKKVNCSTSVQPMIKHSLKIRRDADSTGNHIIYVYVSLNRKKIYLPTGVKIPLDQWNEKEGRIKDTFPGANEFNMIINECNSKVHHINTEFYLNKRPVSLELIKKEFFRNDNAANFITWCMEQNIKRESEPVAATTLELHNSVLNKLSNWKGGELYFYDLNENLLQHFEKYLLNIGNSVNTVHKNMKVLRFFVNRAIRDGLIKETPFKSYRMKREKTLPECLTEYQLSQAFKIYTDADLRDSERKVLRAFLFACCTGLRISDIKRITWNNVAHKTITFTMYKTKNTAPAKVKIPLTNTAVRLMRDTNTSSGHIFEMPVSDSWANDQLKQALKSFPDHSILHFHTARHTFATHYLRKNKGDIVTLKTLLGHSKIEQTMVYLTIDEGWLNEGMANFGEWL